MKKKMKIKNKESQRERAKYDLFFCTIYIYNIIEAMQTRIGTTAEATSASSLE